MSFDFTAITEVRLDGGAHDRPEDGMCAMEMVAWFNGEPHSAHPACTSPVLASYVRMINDSMPDDLRDTLLKPLLPRLVGTVSQEHEQARAEALVWFVIRNQVPNALRAIGLHYHATKLIEAKTLKDAEVVAGAAEIAARAARTAARAAGAVAWAAEAVAWVVPDQWPLAIQALEEAIALGPTGDFGPDPVERHEALRQMVKV